MQLSGRIWLISFCCAVFALACGEDISVPPFLEENLDPSACDGHWTPISPPSGKTGWYEGGIDNFVFGTFTPTAAEYEGVILHIDEQNGQITQESIPAEIDNVTTIVKVDGRYIALGAIIPDDPSTEQIYQVLVRKEDDSWDRMTTHAGYPLGMCAMSVDDYMVAVIPQHIASMTPPPPVLVERFANDKGFTVATDLTHANVRCLKEYMFLGGSNQMTQPYQARLVGVDHAGVVSYISLDPAVEFVRSFSIFDGKDVNRLLLSGESFKPSSDIVLMKVENNTWTDTTIFSKTRFLNEIVAIDDAYAALVWDPSTMPYGQGFVTFDLLEKPVKLQTLPEPDMINPFYLWRTETAYFIAGSGALPGGGSVDQPALLMCRP